MTKRSSLDLGEVDRRFTMGFVKNKFPTIWIAPRSLKTTRNLH